MTHSTENYKGFIIEKRTDTKNNTCIIYENDCLLKCIAGDILEDGTENSIQKAKSFIDNI